MKCAVCDKKQKAETMVYSGFECRSCGVKHHYCRDVAACERRAARNKKKAKP